MAPKLGCKMPMNSHYRITYCEQLVEFMGRGYSLTAFAGEIGVTRGKLEQWRAKYPTFARAVEQGQARRARLLEDHLLAAKGAGAFSAHMEALKSAAPDDWRRDEAVRSKAGSRDVTPAFVDLPDNGRG